jgi:hypothetical protein
MQNSIGNVWERFGDPIYHVNYKTTRRDVGGDTIESRRKKIEADFTAAIASKRHGKSADFVTAVNTDASIEVKVIGADNQVLQMDVPARHLLEQIVSKTNLPAWMLGIYWSTTERMAPLEVEAALQDAKIRQLAMTPEFIRLFSMFLKVRGRTWKTVTTDPEKPGDWGFVFETPNLRDLVAQAQARFLNAQADMMGSAGGAAQSTTTVNVGAAGATFEIHSKMASSRSRVPDHKEKKCSCEGHHKELSRPVDWPELDRVEEDYGTELEYDWAEFKDRVFTILRLNETQSAERTAHGEQSKTPLPGTVGEKDLFEDGDVFTYSEEQRKAIMKSMEKHIGQYDPTEPDSPVKYYYGQSYSLGLIQAAHLIGKDRPILDLIKNREIYDELVRRGFDLVKKRLIPGNWQTGSSGDGGPVIADKPRGMWQLG